MSRVVHSDVPTPFARSLRSLETDGFRGLGVGFAVAAVLLVAWVWWFVAARVSVYEVTDRARLEVDEAMHPLESRVKGRVTATRLELGRNVRAGDLLVELDADEEALRLEEEQTRYATFAPQIADLSAEIGAEQRALDAAGTGAVAAIDEARSQLAEAEPPARLAAEEAARAVRLRSTGVVSEVDVLRLQTEAERRRSTVESLRLAIQRLERNRQTEQNDRRVRVQHLQGQLTQLRGQASTTNSTIRRMENEIERRRIRAPVDGRLGEVAELRLGAFVDEGQKLGAIIPSGRLRVVAEFAPSAALGRIRPNQPARLRLLGFPWTEYGTVGASVETVASEVRASTVRVELAIRPEGVTAVPFQHGLPGTVEVEVERISPAALVLRAAGRVIMRPADASTP